jgi:hypothetical protein
MGVVERELMSEAVKQYNTAKESSVVHSQSVSEALESLSLRCLSRVNPLGSSSGASCLL